jgi:hypothetical protein
MSTHSWPEQASVKASTSLEKIMILKDHCRTIIQYFLGNLQGSAPPPTYTAQLAVITYDVLDEFLSEDQQHMRHTIDRMGATHIRLEQTAKEIATVAAAAVSRSNAQGANVPVHSKLIEKWAEGTNPGSTTAPHTSIPTSITPGADGPTEHDLRIRLRWKGPAPYRNAPPNMICTAISKLLDNSENPAISNIDVAAVRKLKSGDLDLYTHTVAEKERLVYNADEWLPRLERGQQVRLLGTQYAILVHSVPAEFFPKSRAVGEAIEEVVRSNPATLTQNEIAYLGWVKGHLGIGQKTRSSLVVALSDPRAANKVIQEGLFLRSERMRTELYDPGCRVVQCAKCLQFGHVMAMCSSAVCCPFCTLAHARKQCPDRKNSERYKCALCRQRHAATDRRNCPKWREQVAILEVVQRKKARLFPVPNKVSPGVAAPENSSGDFRTNPQAQGAANTNSANTKTGQSEKQALEQFSQRSRQQTS